MLRVGSGWWRVVVIDRRAPLTVVCQAIPDYEGLQDSIQAVDGVISSRLLFGGTVRMA